MIEQVLTLFRGLHAAEALLDGVRVPVHRGIFHVCRRHRVCEVAAAAVDPRDSVT
jgi:hypothetical protein